MPLRTNFYWLTILSLAVFFCLLYFWALLFPGNAGAEAAKYFTAEEIIKGRNYASVPRLLYIGGFMASTAVLLGLLYSGRALVWFEYFRGAVGGSQWGGLTLYLGALFIFLTIIYLPFKYLGSYIWNQRWGFSTQSLGSWWWDFLKSSALEMLLFMLGSVILIFIIEQGGQKWWLAGAGLFSVWLVVQMYLWPVLVTPLFYNFTPATEPELVSMVQELAAKAEIPVEDILIMDASSKTTKANAYFAGLGKTKRIVLYDNLLNNYPRDEVRAVIAHEMAHWKQGHILKGIALGSLGSFLFWGFLYYLYRQLAAGGDGQMAQTVVLFLLVLQVVTFVSSPLQNYISRGMEKEADMVAVSLTEDAPAAMRLHIRLAESNLADIAPPRFIRWFSYTHPDILTRLSDIEKAGSGSQ